MRILIDLQACQNGSRFRGIGRYTTGIVTEILQQSNDKNDYYILLNGLLTDNIDEIFHYFSQYVPKEKIIIWHGVGPVEGHDSSNDHSRELSVLLRDSKIQSIAPDIVFLPTFFEGFVDDSVISTKQYSKHHRYICISTCHDLIPLLQTEVYLDPHPQFKKYYLAQVKDFRQSDGFLSVSESSKLELIEYLDIALEKIVNTSEGVEEIFKNSYPSVKKIANLLDIPTLEDKKIILYSGASDERKNHLKLIKAYSLLSEFHKKTTILVFAGGMPGDHVAKFKKYATMNGVDATQLFFTGRISDQAMIDLYSTCYLFVFPSWHEGFGLPALEAMSCGAPVIASNTSSLPEVVGLPELLFNPYDAVDIAKSINRFLVDEPYRDKMAKYCYERSKTFSWKASAITAVKFFDEMFAKNSLSHDNGVRKIPSNIDIKNELIHNIKKLLPMSELSLTEKDKLILAIIKNFRSPRTHKRFYLDLSILVRVDFATGVQRVTKELYNNILKICPDGYEIVPISYNDKDFKFDEVSIFPYSRAPHLRLGREELLDFCEGDIFLGLDLNYTILRMGDVIDKMKLRGCQVYFLVHDLLPLKLGASFFTPGSVKAQYHWGKQLLKADGIISVSKATLKDVSYYLNMYNGYVLDNNVERNKVIYPASIKLSWSHHGANLEDSNKLTSIKKPLALDKINFELPVFLMVGSIEPRKGHLEVIEAFSNLWQQGYEGILLIVASRTWNSDLTAEIIRTSAFLDTKLFWLNSIDDTGLIYAYSHATALIAASIDEGFGLPLIEASFYDLPVICRDIPVFREVGNEFSIYYSSESQLLDIIENWQVTTANLNSNPTNVLLSWEQSAHNLLNIIFDDHYTEIWKKDPNLFILPICSDKFGTVVGEQVEDKIITASKAGLLLYGRYFAIGKGIYECKIFGKAEFNQNIHVKLIQIIGNTEKQLYINTVNLNKSFLNHDMPELLGEFSFELLEGFEDIEIYIHVEKENSFSITSFEIQSISNET